MANLNKPSYELAELASAAYKIKEDAYTVASKAAHEGDSSLQKEMYIVSDMALKLVNKLREMEAEQETKENELADNGTLDWDLDDFEEIKD